MTTPVTGRTRRSGQGAARSIFGASGGVAAGLLLDVVIAASYGAGEATDALFVALRLPLGLAALVMASANQSLVPTFTRWSHHRERASYGRSVSLVFCAALTLGGLIAVVGIALAGPLTAVTAPGLSDADAATAVTMTRVLFCLVPLVTCAEVLRAHMNAVGRFGIPAAMNVVMNGLAALIVLGLGRHDISVAAWAYVSGAAAQLVFMMVMSYRTGLALRPVFAFKDPDLAGVARRSTRPLGAASLNPVARVVEQVIVSFLPPGSITIVNYANRLVSAIGGTVLFRSVMVVLLPRLSLAWDAEDRDAVRRIVREGTLLMLRLALPLTVLMALLSQAGALVVFRRGNFDRHDAMLLGIALAVYASSLVGQGVQRAWLAPFYAKLEMTPPFRNSVYGLVANLVLLFPLVYLLRDSETGALVGVALAYSLSQYVNVAHAWWCLRSLVDGLFDRTWWRPIVTMVSGTLVEAVVIGTGVLLLDLGDTDSRWLLLAKASALALGGLAAYAAVAWRPRRTPGRPASAAGS